MCGRCFTTHEHEQYAMTCCNGAKPEKPKVAAPRSTQIGGTHYAKHAIQPWDAMREWLGQEGFEAYLRGNIVKYIARYPDKGGIEDVRKARHYLDKLIEVMGA